GASASCTAGFAHSSAASRTSPTRAVIEAAAISTGAVTAPRAWTAASPRWPSAAVRAARTRPRPTTPRLVSRPQAAREPKPAAPNRPNIVSPSCLGKDERALPPGDREGPYGTSPGQAQGHANARLPDTARLAPWGSRGSKGGSVRGVRA